MFSVEIIKDVKDADEFGKFADAKDFPYSPAVIIQYVERHLGQPHTLFLKAIRDGEVKGVACAEEIELPPGVHVNFLGSSDREATFQMMLALTKWAEYLGHSWIQHSVHKSPEAWKRLIGAGETIAYIRGGTPQSLERSMEEKIGRIKQ